MNTPDLSIIILTYNTKDLTYQAVKSIEDNYQEEVRSGNYEVIVTDNASTDGTLSFFQDFKKKTTITSFHIVDNGGNIGFSAGNNKGVPYANGRYVLFLNPDTIVYKKTLTHMLSFVDTTEGVGAATCKLINADGELDFNCHRGFPTPWNAFCYFSGLQRLFPRSRIFAGYTQGWKDLTTTHQVSAIEGAFMLMPKEVGERVGWWDEDYFFYGEDLQFCYDIRQLGYSIFYVGEAEIMHIGGASSGIKKKTKHLTKENIEGKRRLQKARFNAMKIFYQKNYSRTYPKWLQWLIIQGITYLEKKTLKGLTIPHE